LAASVERQEVVVITLRFRAPLRSDIPSGHQEIFAENI
jgi:hypothetical protein